MKIMIKRQNIKTESEEELEVNVEYIDDCIELEFEGTRLIFPLETFFGIFKK